MTCTAFSFRSSFNAFFVTKRDMNNATLVRSHRTKLDAPVLGARAMSCRIRKVLKLLALTALVAFDIYDDGITEAHCTRRDSRNKELECIERFAMAANQDGKIAACDIKNQLTFIAVVLIDGNVAHIKILQDVLQGSNSGIRNSIDFLISEVLR